MIDFRGMLMVQTRNLLPEIHVLCDVTQCSLVSCLDHFYLLTVGVGVILHLVTLSDTLSKTHLHEGSLLRRDLYLTTHDTHKRLTSMSPAGFAPINPASGRQHTYALNFAAIAK